ncbi:unnamed protein product [Moneuplotes crassus]|uniref:ABC transporter domain-containing protein n=1 Tax=Euplotes crassus TaxID=5936 RepID=A0AAD1YAU6_EUPCR|nr:unnamed protein product [Moneuplotes crassus]
MSNSQDLENTPQNENNVYVHEGGEIKRKESLFDKRSRSLKLSWHNLSYTVKAKYTKEERARLGVQEKYYDKEIVKNASGYCEQGDALFIMGSSGAGKTTLLNILSDQISLKNAALSGQVLINDSIRVTSDNFGSYAAYITQEDYLYESFTCEKCIEFAARLRLNLTREETSERVDEIIEKMGLQKCRKTMVGSEAIKGLSGGEKRRTSMAVELVTNPEILFLDEPTSGLDSFTAQKIVSLLIDFANRGKTVIATIHQPNSEVFQKFPKLLLLMDGHTIYQGNTMESVEHFKSIGHQVPEFSNPSDYYLKEFYISFERTEEEQKKMNALVDGYNRDILPKIESAMESRNYDQVTEKELQKGMTKASFLLQFWILLCRSAYNVFFHPMIIKFKTIGILTIALVCMAVLWDPGEDREGIRGTIGSFLFITATFTFAPIATTTRSFSAEKPVFMKEYGNKTYGLIPYAISNSLVEIPFESTYALIFAIIVYFSMGLEAEVGKFFIFLFAITLNSFCAMSMGLFLSAAVPNEESAIALTNLFVAPALLLCGVPVNLGTLDPWVGWLTYISPLRYTVEILIRNEYEGRSFSEIENPISSLDYNLNIPFNFAILGVMILTFRGLAVLFLRITSKR